MSIRNLAKRAALYAPPVRRLYQAVLHETEVNRTLRNELARAEEREHERDHLQTDYEQCTANAEELRARLQESELRREQIDSHAKGQVSELQATIAYQKARFTEYARILAGVSVLSSELNDLRRLLYSAQNGTADGQTSFLLRSLYLDLLEKAVCGSLYEDPSVTPGSRPHL